MPEVDEGIGAENQEVRPAGERDRAARQLLGFGGSAELGQDLCARGSPLNLRGEIVFGTRALAELCVAQRLVDASLCENGLTQHGEDIRKVARLPGALELLGGSV